MVPGFRLGFKFEGFRVCRVYGYGWGLSEACLAFCKMWQFLSPGDSRDMEDIRMSC